MKTTELWNGFKFSYHCPVHFCQPTSSNSFPARARFDQREAPAIPNECNVCTFQQSLENREDTTIVGKTFRYTLEGKLSKTSLKKETLSLVRSPVDLNQT